MPDRFIRVIPSTGIEDIPLKNPGISTVLVVSVVCRTPMPNVVIDVPKHILGESALREPIENENAPQE